MDSPDLLINVKELYNNSLFLKTSAVSIHSSMYQGLSAKLWQLERVVASPGALSV